MGFRSCGILVRNDKVLLVKHRVDGKDYFVLPGGGSENGERPRETLRREFLEETGLNVSIKRFLFKKHSKRSNRMEYYYEVVSDDNKAPSHLGAPDVSLGVLQGVEWIDFSALQKTILHPSMVKTFILEQIAGIKKE